MLIHYAFPKLRSLTEDFQHNGALPHFSNQVITYLNSERSENWIGRGGLVCWPLCSPDLTIFDFYLWGYINSKIYTTPIGSIEDLKRNVRPEIRRIIPETSEKVSYNAELRLNYISKVRDGNIENIMN